MNLPDDMAEFFSMGGFGLYVWGAMGVSFALLLGEVWQVRQQRRTLRRQQARPQRIGQRMDTP